MTTEQDGRAPAPGPSPEAIAAAAECYGAILADPERRAQLLAAREQGRTERDDERS